MENQNLIPKNLLNSYVETNRSKLDSSLVSLRILRQIDNFMDYHEISQRGLATALDVSESYVSQLMSGTKKINVALISKFEKSFNVEFDFKLKRKFISNAMFESVNTPVQLESNNLNYSSIKTFTFNTVSNSEYIIDTEFTEL